MGVSSSSLEDKGVDCIYLFLKKYLFNCKVEFLERENEKDTVRKMSCLLVQSQNSQGCVRPKPAASNCPQLLCG